MFHNPGQRMSDKQSLITEVRHVPPEDRIVPHEAHSSLLGKHAVLVPTLFTLSVHIKALKT